MSQFAIEWRDAGKEPRHPPNPAYPHGRHIIGVRPGATSCKIDLPYPAKRIGYYSVTCRLCGFTIAISTAGRPDDTRSVTVPCQPIGPKH